MEEQTKQSKDLSYKDLLYRYEEERKKAQKLAQDSLNLHIVNKHLKAENTRVRNQFDNMKDKLLSCEHFFQLIEGSDNKDYREHRLNKALRPDGIVFLVEHMKETAEQALNVINDKIKRRRHEDNG